MNLPTFAALTGIALILAGCATPTPHATSLPGKFVVHSGGFFGDSFSVERERNQLLYRRQSSRPFQSRTVRISPTEEQWRAFWAEADAVGLWKWKSHYRPDGIVNDGTQWSIVIEHQGRQINSEGDNAYPGNSSPTKTQSPLPSRRFQQFISALRVLIDERPFY